MKENLARPRPEAEVLEALLGTISPPLELTSGKPGEVGQIVIRRLVLEGSGLMGLEDPVDALEWSGMGNHTILAARIASFLSEKAREAGLPTDPHLVLNTHLNSHTMRRTWDEGRWYRGGSPKDPEGRPLTSEALGVAYLEEIDAPEEIIRLVAALGHGTEVDPAVYGSWDYRIALYADHRCAQSVASLGERMADFFIRNFVEAQSVTPQLRAESIAVFDGIIRLGKAEATTPEDAAKILRGVFQTKQSDRVSSLEELMALVLRDAQTEAELEQRGIDVAGLSDTHPPIPRWERYIRRLHFNDSEARAFARLQELQGALNQGTDDPRLIEERSDREFPHTWWGDGMRGLFAAQDGEPYTSKHGKRRGIQRAIEFFLYLDALPHSDPQVLNE